MQLYAIHNLYEKLSTAFLDPVAGIVPKVALRAFGRRKEPHIISHRNLVSSSQLAKVACLQKPKTMFNSALLII